MKVLKFVSGNLLTHPTVEVIGHQANCQNTFGSGIAKSIKVMYPEAYAADTTSANKKQNTLGTFSSAEINVDGTGQNRHGNRIRVIYNLYGQDLGTGLDSSGRRTNYEALYSALVEMREWCESDQLPVVGFPYLMGSGLGGGRWEIVERLIGVAFDGYKKDVIIVSLNTNTL